MKRWLSFALVALVLLGGVTACTQDAKKTTGSKSQPQQSAESPWPMFGHDAQRT